MNTVLDEAEEVYVKKGNRRRLGRVILKGDNISLICNIRYYYEIANIIIIAIDKKSTGGILA